MHGAGGVPGTGGAPATGGAFGTGGAPGTGGSASPGSVVLQIVLPPGRTYCDENPSCIGVQHLTLLTASGQPVNFGSSLGCGISCEACAAIPCPELPVIACPAGPFGVSVESYTLTWDGSYTEQDSCRPSGSSLTQSCYASKFAAPGTYVARFCATPGTLALTDGGPAYTCTATGTQECVEVGFLFPSPQPVTITLPVD
ncbi:MAG TPA: hypothetical protein VKZ18_10105 [Polyangia bacterium]|nr:hypothetical protein [Polyangia bacterium]